MVMSHSPPPIELERVSKRYGNREVVSDVSFSVGKGEIVGFLGPNGAGKTTTLRMIVGFLAPTSGRIRIAGHDIAQQRVRLARQIGYAPERPPLYDAFDVAGYLRFVARAKGVPRNEIASEMDHAIAACRLETVVQEEVYKLSKGYRQRLGLAQALLGAPDLLLLDEPTSGLDPGQIHETREVIRAFGRGQSVLLSTHILPEVTLLCERVAILHQGRLLAIDSPAGLGRTMEQGRRVDLLATAPAGDLRCALLALDGVRAVEVEDEAAATLRVACLVDGRDGIEADVARTVAGRWALHGLQRKDPSLEDVFLHYVRAGDPA